MSSALDMSLDDLIRNNKKPPGKPSGGGRRRGSGPGPGPARRFPNRGANRSNPYHKPVQAPDTMWKHDMVTDQMAGYSAPVGGASAIETGTKLYVSNLDYGVSNEDIKELFSEVGDLKRYSIHYDRSGRSKGTAEVVLSRRTDALAAVKRYNNVQLDGKPMKIEIVGTNIVTPVPVPPVVNSILGQNVRSGEQRIGGAAGQPRGGGSGGRGRGRTGGGGGGGRGRGRAEPVSAEDLDADLDKYHAEAMQTN